MSTAGLTLVKCEVLKLSGIDGAFKPAACDLIFIDGLNFERHTEYSESTRSKLRGYLKALLQTEWSIHTMGKRLNAEQEHDTDSLFRFVSPL